MPDEKEQRQPTKWPRFRSPHAYTPKETKAMRTKRLRVQRQLGFRVRQLRAAKGWAQEEFADLCGMHRSHMGEIERGESNFTLATMRILTQKLETTISDFFEGIA